MTTNVLAIERLAEEIVSRLTIEIEASGRHIHLSRGDLEALFGAGYQLNRVKDLSQPGQYACAERLTLEGPKGKLERVVILGPERSESQAEISLTDAVALGVTPPVRLSGEVQGTPGITLRRGERELRRDRGLMVAKRHIHMTPETAEHYHIADKEILQVRVEGERAMVFDEVVARVSASYADAMHIDYDEMNAAGLSGTTYGIVMKK